MTSVTDAAAPAGAPADTSARKVGSGAESSLLASLTVALVAGSGLAFAARAGATALLIAVAAVQAVFAFAWVFGTAMPGRRGALVIAALAAAGSDVSASVWPHGRLGVLLAVLGLAVPVMFVHQLMRGAARVQVVSSLSAVAMLVLAEVALPALLQLRHEFTDAGLGGRVVSAAVAATAGALVVGYLVDMLLPAPRFDPDVPRGLLALVASAGLGGSVGYLILNTEVGFAQGRSAFIGAALGALAGLLGIAAAFVLFTTPETSSRLGRALRPVLAALLPICVVSPAAFLLCLALRS
ncbi:MAG: conserved rane protein of unknown function [Jatrophihabitans sp.]|nr:conserved rane protein of unknown function [Jatrophihabitans sp.]